MRPDLVFLDLESSGLESDSYPIEVGLCDDALACRSWLIRPPPAWSARGWSLNAASLHGIARADLDGGLDPSRTADLLDEALAGRTAVSDMPAFEAAWLDLLYAEAGRRRTFPVIDLAEALTGDLPPGDAAFASRAMAWEEACMACAVPWPHTHRAGEDALCLAAAWRAAMDPAFMLSVLTA